MAEASGSSHEATAIKTDGPAMQTAPGAFRGRHAGAHCGGVDPGQSKYGPAFLPPDARTHRRAFIGTQPVQGLDRSRRYRFSGHAQRQAGRRRSSMGPGIRAAWERAQGLHRDGARHRARNSISRPEGAITVRFGCLRRNARSPQRPGCVPFPPSTDRTACWLSAWRGVHQQHREFLEPIEAALEAIQRRAAESLSLVPDGMRVAL